MYIVGDTGRRVIPVGRILFLAMTDCEELNWGTDWGTDAKIDVFA